MKGKYDRGSYTTFGWMHVSKTRGYRFYAWRKEMAREWRSTPFWLKIAIILGFIVVALQSFFETR